MCRSVSTVARIPTTSEDGSHYALASNFAMGCNNRRLRAVLACLNAYASLLSFGSLQARPKKEIPIGSPKINPMGTVDVGISNNRCQARTSCDGVAPIQQVRTPSRRSSWRDQRIEFELIQRAIDSHFSLPGQTISVPHRSCRCRTPSKAPSSSTTGKDVIFRCSMMSSAVIANASGPIVTGLRVIH